MKTLVKILLVSMVMGCAQVSTLNLKKHQFGQQPNKIIWIQVSSMNFEHIAFSKFNLPSIESHTAFEDFTCYGEMWNYSLYDIRPSGELSMLIQTSGKKNMKGECSDYSEKPIWKYLSRYNYKTGILEYLPEANSSLTKSQTCENDKKDPYLKNTTLWKMAKAPAGQKDFFHVSEAKPFLPDTVYYDKSCQSGDCFTLFSDNTIDIFEKFSKNTKNYFFLIRDFSYAEAFNSKNIPKMKFALGELEKTLKYFQKKMERNEDMLVLVTFASPQGLDFPKAGAEWNQFESKGNFINYRNTSLTSSVMASGARAENFCGFFDQSQAMERIFIGSKKQGLEYYIKNPFN